MKIHLMYNMHFRGAHACNARAPWIYRQGNATNIEKSMNERARYRLISYEEKCIPSTRHIQCPYTIFHLQKTYTMSIHHMPCPYTIHHVARPHTMSPEHTYRVHRHHRGSGPQKIKNLKFS